MHAVVIVSYLLRCASQSTHKMVKPTLQNQYPIIVKCFNIGTLSVNLYIGSSLLKTLLDGKDMEYSSVAKSVT